MNTQIKNLHEIGIKYGTDKATSHDFCHFYEKYFNPLRNDNLTILEIGVWHGSSLKMLSEYFKNSNIFAIDINDAKEYETDRIKTYICDQSDRSKLLNIFDNIQFDIIIDDGGHKMDQQQISFGVLFKKLKNNGIYIIEDLHTSLNPGYRYNKSYETSTLNILDNFKKNNTIISEYMTKMEIEYLNSNIELIDIFRINNDKTSFKESITSVILKNK